MLTSFYSPQHEHPERGSVTCRAPTEFSLELTSRLVQMFSSTGDTVLDPFCGTATTMVAALEHGRNSIGVELDTDYCKMAASRLMNENSSLFGQARFQIELKPHAAVEAVATLAETPPSYRTRTQKKPPRKKRLDTSSA